MINTVRKSLRQTKAKIGDNYVVTMTAWGPFTLGARLVGEESMMKATFKKPAFVEKVVDFATDVLIHLYEPIVADKTLEVISLADPDRLGRPHLTKAVRKVRRTGSQEVHGLGQVKGRPYPGPHLRQHYGPAGPVPAHGR